MSLLPLLPELRGLEPLPHIRGTLDPAILKQGHKPRHF